MSSKFSMSNQTVKTPAVCFPTVTLPLIPPLIPDPTLSPKGTLNVHIRVYWINWMFQVQTLCNLILWFNYDYDNDRYDRSFEFLNVYGHLTMANAQPPPPSHFWDISVTISVDGEFLDEANIDNVYIDDIRTCDVGPLKYTIATTAFGNVYVEITVME